MDLIFMATLVAFAFWMVKSKEQRHRIALLGAHLGKFQIEKHMETLTQGYLRALGEADPNRREQIFALLRPTELALGNQFERFAADFARVDRDEARVSLLPMYLPFVSRLPAATFDLREALSIHSRGIANAVAEDNPAQARDKAFTLSAELFLMQHSCHWFCKSKTVASARMMARHATPYDKVIASVAPATRSAYCALVGSDVRTRA